MNLCPFHLKMKISEPGKSSRTTKRGTTAVCQAARIWYIYIHRYIYYIYVDTYLAESFSMALFVGIPLRSRRDMVCFISPSNHRSTRFNAP